MFSKYLAPYYHLYIYEGYTFSEKVVIKSNQLEDH